MKGQGINMDERQQTLPEKGYERSMHHNYMILSSYDFFGQEENEDDYRTRMLLENRIPGLVPVTCRKNMGEKKYYYEINSFPSLERLYEKQEIGYEELNKLLNGCIRVFEQLEEYLLDGSQLVLSPDFIYVHMDTHEPFFVCYPEYHGDIRQSFMELMDYLLTRIDHTQEQAVWLAYQVYRYTRNPNYVIGEIKELLLDARELWGDSVKGDDSTKIERNLDSSDDLCMNKRYAGEKNMEICHENDYVYKEKEQTYIETSKSADTQEEGVDNHSWSKNILGALLCTLLALSAVGIIFGARLLKLTTLSQKQEVSLYGAIGMSVVAAILFFVSIVKRWKQENQLQELSEEPEDEIEYWKQDIEVLEREDGHRRSEKREESLCVQYTSELSGATVLLSQEPLQERFLKGMVNGEEIQVPLKHFPMILGKLASVSDFVIRDNTVSRMHARLEQRDGQIYISDLNSTNGTIRNGDMLAMNEEVSLEPGDRIMLGRVCFTFC